MIKTLLSTIVDLVLGGPVLNPPAKPLPEILFYPVIFANGRDDDTEGLKAFLENRPVMCRGKLIAPGDHVLFGMDLQLSVLSLWIMADGKLLSVVGYNVPGAKIVPVDVGHGANRTISGGCLTFNCPVQP